MSSTILLRRNDDSPIHVPHDRLDAGWSARAELREFPTGPVLEQWSTGAQSAVIEGGELLLLTDRISNPQWTLGEVTVHLTDPSGARTVLDPIRVRLR